MNILVTGGAGFIGSNLVKRLVQEEYIVTVIDNFYTGNKDNLKGLEQKIKIISGTSGETQKFNENYDIIFHKGIYSSTPMYKEKPSRVADVIGDFINLLEYARKNETKIVWASTSSLYNGQPPPHKENMEIKVTDLYTEARYEMERLAQLYTQLYGVKNIALRYFSMYGPNEKTKGTYANLVSQFLWALQKNEQPIVYGDGKQTRDFMYIDDAIEANIHAMKSTIPFGVYNIGTGVETTVNAMLNLLNKKLNKKITPKYVDSKIANYVMRTQADTTKAEKELGFKAKIRLEEGIERLITYY